MIKNVIWSLFSVSLSIFVVTFLGYVYATQIGYGYPWNFRILSAVTIPSFFDHLPYILTLRFEPILGPIGKSLEQSLINAIKASSGLLGLSFSLSIATGVLLGFTAAKKTGIAKWLTPLATFGAALPSFYLGSLLIVAAIYYAILIRPASGIGIPLQGFGWDWHLLLPTLVLMFRPTFTIAFITANFLNDEYNKQYVLAAQSLGFPWKVIRGKFTFLNVFPHIVSSIIFSFRYTLGELILVEWLFGWPGIGRMFVLTFVPRGLLSGSQAVPDNTLFMNPPLVSALLTVFALLYLLPHLFTSLALKGIDPRLRPDNESRFADSLLARRHDHSTKVNWYLLFGSILILFTLFLAIWGPALAPKDPLERYPILEVGGNWKTPPYQPLTPGFPLGSDQFGRDLLSQLLWAVRPTLTLVLAIALVRSGIGAFVGVLSGWFSNWFSRTLEFITIQTLSIPIIVVGLAVVAVNSINPGLGIFIIALSLTGWADTAQAIRQQAVMIRQQQLPDRSNRQPNVEHRIIYT